jgi:hypothetical protein
MSFINSLPRGTLIVSGGADGVDSWAIEIASSLGLETIVFQPDWERLGRKAGPIRNAKIVAHVDELAAFWDGRSRGTLNTVVLATNASVPVKVFDSAGNILPLERVLQQARERGVTAGIEKANVMTRT